MKTTHPTQGLTIKPVTVVSVLDHTADVRDRNGSHHTLRTDVLRSKGPAPKPGEVWWIDRYLGGWSFAAIIGYTEQEVEAFSGRKTATYQTADLTLGQTEEGHIELAKGYRILDITTSLAARVRLYSRQADLIADRGRLVSDIPDASNGIVMDFLTIPTMLSAPLSPIPEGANLESTPSASIPISVTAVNGGVITATLTWVRTE